ncbi:ATP-binding protein [Halocola ammonii]
MKAYLNRKAIAICILNVILCFVLSHVTALAQQKTLDSTRVYSLIEKSKTPSIDSALAYLDTALLISKEKNMKKALAETYHEIGAVHKSISVYDKALENYFESLRIAEENNDSVRLSDVYSSIGNVYLVTQELDDALEYFEKSRNISQAMNDSLGVMISYINTGAANQKKRNLDVALDYYNRALKTARANNYTGDIAILNGNIGSTYMVKGELDSAKLYLEKTLILKEEIGKDASTVHTLNDLADLMTRRKEPEKGVAYAKRAVEISKKINNGRHLKYGYLYLSENQKLLGDFENAYKNLNLYTELNDSLFGVEKAEQFKELQVKYDTEKKDAAIQLLQREQEIANFRTRIYLLIGFLVLLVAAVLVYWQWQNARKNKELLAKEKEVDRLKADFFANISHEFRTPLTLILSPVESMLEQESDPQKVKNLRGLQKNAQRLLNLINQILDLSRIEAGQLTLNVQETNLVSLAKGVTMSFESLADSRDIKIDFESRANTLEVFCNVRQFETILINIISNALKFTPRGGQVKVKLTEKSTAAKLNGSPAVEIEVSDNGQGIDPEKLPHIFDRYYQVENTNINTQGSGIGLALARELVLLHKGKIEVESETNKGTTFRFWLPLGQAHLRESQIYSNTDVKLTRSNNEIEPSTEIPDKSISGATLPQLLLVEDNKDVRDYVKSILAADYQIEEAENGKIGLELALEIIPDLVISDVMMPEMDGYELSETLKKDERTSHIPVILLTAKASAESRIAGLETEADIYLSKPFVPQELKLSAKNLITSRKKLREKYSKGLKFEPSEVAINSVDEQFLSRLIKVIEANFAKPEFTVEKLSSEIGMSRSQLHRKLQALTNESASNFIRSFRLQRAHQLLEKKAGTISEVCYRVGFNSHSYFTKCFLEEFGYKPSEINSST